MSGRTSASISSFDTANWTKRLEREFGGRVTLSVQLPVREVPGIAYTARLSFRREPNGRDGAVYERGVSGCWPSVESRTFFGMVLRLIIELEKVLSEDKREAERATQGRLQL